MSMRILENNLLFVASFIVIAIGLLFSLTQINAAEMVGWKIFKERDGLFTIKYPSNWSPYKAYPDSSAPINIYFAYEGRAHSFAELVLYGEESIYSNATDLIDSRPTSVQNKDDYNLLQETQCGKYKIKNISACDTIVTYKDTDLEGNPTIKDLIIGTIDEDGIGYTVEYYATKDLYDIFLPVAKEMINSLNFTGTVPSPDGESPSTTDESPELPPLTESPSIGKL